MEAKHPSVGLLAIKTKMEHGQLHILTSSGDKMYHFMGGRKAFPNVKFLKKMLQT